jgi:hypothetical protein
MFGIKFFEPNTEMLQWLKDYAGDRIIYDIGAGEGHITRGLNKLGAKVLGFEPMGEFDGNEYLKTGVRIMPWRIEDHPKLFVGVGNKVLLLFARPCHSDFVANTLDMKDADTEVLYITKEENFFNYNDLGNHWERAELVKHKGTSKDKEVVYSVK